MGFCVDNDRDGRDGERAVDLPLDSSAYQAALEQRLATSQLREKVAIDAHVDMQASYR